MEPPDPSFADEFNVPLEDAILVFDVRRAAVSLPFQVHLLKWLIEADLVAFSRARFDFADEAPKDAQHGVFLRYPPPHANDGFKTDSAPFLSHSDFFAGPTCAC